MSKYINKLEKTKAYLLSLPGGENNLKEYESIASILLTWASRVEHYKDILDDRPVDDQALDIVKRVEALKKQYNSPSLQLTRPSLCLSKEHKGAITFRFVYKSKVHHRDVREDQIDETIQAIVKEEQRTKAAFESIDIEAIRDDMQQVLDKHRIFDYKKDSYGIYDEKVALEVIREGHSFTFNFEPD